MRCPARHYRNAALACLARHWEVRGLAICLALRLAIFADADSGFLRFDLT